MIRDALHTYIDIPSNAEYFSDYTNKIKAIEGYTWTKENTFYIWLKATNSTMDWIINFFYPKKIVPYNNINLKIRVHRGYIKRYKLVRNLLHYKYLESKATNVIVLGYSMGGGLAPICAVDMEYNFHIPVASFAFEPPRVGNKHFKQSVEHRVDAHYTVYGNDIVTKLPPSLFNFWHIGKRHSYGSKNVWYKLSIKDHPLSNLIKDIL